MPFLALRLRSKNPRPEGLICSLILCFVGLFSSSYFSKQTYIQLALEFS